MTGTQYEQFVRAVLVRRLGWSPDKFRSALVPGKQFPDGKGSKHQIDLLYVDEDEIAKYKIIIECKYWSKKVDQPVVVKLAQVKSAISASKAIIVTNCGFTSGAYSVADAEDIALSVITPQIDVDEIDKALSVDDLFQAIDAKLQENPKGYIFDPKRKFAPDPSDRSMDLMSALVSRPTVGRQVTGFTRAIEAPKVVKQIVGNSPAVVHKTMGDFKKK